MTRLSQSTQRRGFAVRRLDELVPAPAGRDWDIRFVSATLLFYGLMGAAFFLVDGLNGSDPAEAPAAHEMASPAGDASDPMRTRYLIRLPQILKDRDASLTPQESR